MIHFQKRIYHLAEVEARILVVSVKKGRTPVGFAEKGKCAEGDLKVRIPVSWMQRGAALCLSRLFVERCSVSIRKAVMFVCFAVCRRRGKAPFCSL